MRGDVGMGFQGLGAGSRNGVDPSRMKGVAPYDSFKSKHEPFGDPVAIDGFVRIFGTTGVKPACRHHQWRDSCLIESDGC